MSTSGKYNFLSKDISRAIQSLYIFVLIMAVIFEIRPKEINDEYSRLILSKIDNILISFILIILMAFVAFLGGPVFREFTIDRGDISILISLLLVVITSLRAILFSIYNRRGI